MSRKLLGLSKRLYGAFQRPLGSIWGVYEAFEWSHGNPLGASGRPHLASQRLQRAFWRPLGTSGTPLGV